MKNQTKKIFIEFDSNVNQRFNKNVETVLFRVTSELINNTLKYASASKSDVSIKFDEANYTIALIYNDNGNGFDMQEVLQKRKGMGLLNIEQRVLTLDGKFKIESSIGKGVFVEIQLPISKDKNID